MTYMNREPPSPLPSQAHHFNNDFLSKIGAMSDGRQTVTFQGNFTAALYKLALSDALQSYKAQGIKAGLLVPGHYLGREGSAAQKTFRLTSADSNSPRRPVTLPQTSESSQDEKLASSHMLEGMHTEEVQEGEEQEDDVRVFFADINGKLDEYSQALYHQLEEAFRAKQLKNDQNSTLTLTPEQQAQRNKASEQFKAEAKLVMKNVMKALEEKSDEKIKEHDKVQKEEIQGQRKEVSGP